MNSRTSETCPVGSTAWSGMVTRRWSGGQYSLFRLALAAVALGHLTPAIWTGGLAESGAGPLVLALILAGAAVLALAAGVLDRIAALALAGGHLLLHGSFPDAVMPGEVALTSLLLIHAAMPPAPYGSWPARGRADPGGGWRVGGGLALAIWMTSALIIALGLVVASPSWGWLMAVPVLPLLWLGRDHPAGWAAASVMMIGPAVLGLAPGPILPLLLLLLLAFDPAWIPPKRSAEATLFFDGDCALCHGAVRFLLAEDRRERFAFAPIGGERFAGTLSADTIARLPDSMALATGTGKLLLKSDAVIGCLHRLGGFWRLVAPPLSILPRPLRDGVYDMIGSRRYRIFGKKTEACPLMTADQRRRFHP